MATKHWFRNIDSKPEQRLIASLVHEAIQTYGIDTIYVRRKSLNVDNIIVDEKLGMFDAAFPCECYVESSEGFQGEGDFLSKFGLEIRDRMILAFSRIAFKENVTDKSPQTERPLEGDLIYVPLNGKLFEIKFVEHEAQFYQMGSMQMFQVTCELYEYNNEVFDTGWDVIDDIWKYKMRHEVRSENQPFNDDQQEGIDAGAFVDDLAELLRVGTPDYVPEQNTPAVNVELEVEGRRVMDWSETDPFSENGRY